MSKNIEAKTVKIFARLYDEDLLRQIEMLVADGQFENKTQVVSRCIEYALPYLSDTKGKAKKEYDVEHALRQQNAMLRELIVNAVMTLNLVSSLYGERLKTLDGAKTSAEDFAQGEYERLPDYYQERLNELMKSL